MTTVRDRHYLMVITDQIMKLVRTAPLRGVTAAEFSKQLMNHWNFSYGYPLHLITDNGRQFTSTFFQEVCRVFIVHNALKITFHPQANVQVERVNRNLLSTLRNYASDHHHDLEFYSLTLRYAYNCQP